MSVLIKNALIVTMNSSRDVIEGSILVEGDRITGLGELGEATAAKVIDARGKVVIPGLIQTHVHLCQTLFRGQADDLELLDWLKLRIWPLEGSHDPDSLYYSAMLGCGELFKGGTTAVIDMGTVRHTEAIMEALLENGMRAISGKCMMDYGEDVPEGLMEDTRASIQESVDLLEKWHNKDKGRIKYAFAPRFVVSCTEELLLEVRDLANGYKVLVHTHASENQGEVQLVERLTGMRNVLYLDKIGLTAPNLVLAHCIWLNDQEMEILVNSRTKIVHCPSCNLKLASGIAKIPELLEKGACVSLGADGAPCNNNMDQFIEMRTAALIQKPIYGPTIMPAQQVFALATIGGAQAMGQEKEIGSLEIGKKADLALVDLRGIHTSPNLAKEKVYSQLVYQARSSDVSLTMVDGRIVMENRILTTIEEEKVKTRCNAAIARITKKAGIN